MKGAISEAEEQKMLRFAVPRQTPPALPPAAISRPRLQALLPDVRAARLTLLEAPPGYGKTCLMQQWHAALIDEGVATSWCTMSSALRTPAAFRAAVQRVLPAALDALSDPTILFLDDMQHLANAEALKELSRLLADAPTALHLVVATRKHLNVPVARLRVRGRLLELQAHDLAFTPDECNRLQGCADVKNSELLTQAEGWPAAVWFALHGAETAQPVRALSRLEPKIADFLHEELFLALPVDVRNFLTQIAILPDFNTSACEAVTKRKDAPRLLRRCSEHGLPLQPAGNQSLHFHPLVAAFLREQLDEREPEEIAELHRRAAAHYRSIGEAGRAAEHAFETGDAELAAQILDQFCEDMFDRGESRTLAALAKRLPPAFLDNYPRISLVLAWHLIVTWDFSRAEQVLRFNRARLNEQAGDGDSTSRLRNLLFHREMWFAVTRDETQDVPGQYNEVIRSFSGTPPLLRASLYTSILIAQREHFRFAEIERLTALIESGLAEAPQPRPDIVLGSAIGVSYLAKGQAVTAEQRLRRALQIEPQVGAPPSGFGAIAALPLAQALYEQNKVTDAATLLNDYLPVAAAAGGWTDMLIAGWLTQAKLLLHDGDRNAALQALERLAEFGHRWDFDRAILVSVAERVDVLCRMGRLDEAEQLCNLAGISEAKPQLPRGLATTRKELRARTWVCYMRSRGQIHEADRVARQWASFFSHLGASTYAVRWTLEVARLRLLNGEPLAAQRSFRQALADAEQGRLLRSILDQDDVLPHLLTLQRDDVASDDTGAEFLRELMHASNVSTDEDLAKFDGDQAKPICPLTPSEQDVLKLVGQGLPNREIGRRLGMVEGTVKWYLRQIYDKLGVRRRWQAYERARRLGLSLERRTIGRK